MKPKRSLRPDLMLEEHAGLVLSVKFPRGVRRPHVFLQIWKISAEWGFPYPVARMPEPKHHSRHGAWFEI